VTDDEELTAALTRLGLDATNWRAVSLLPLVEVAWADGRIQVAERKLLTQVAANYGLPPDSPFLKKWLGKKPPRAELLRARTLLLRLWRRAGPADARQPETLEQLLDLCLRVAEAAGGLFGILFTVEASEREAISEIAASLQLGPELPETVARSWRPPRQELKGPSEVKGPSDATTTNLARKTRKPPNPVADETTKIRPRPIPRKKGSPPKPGYDPDATTRHQPRSAPQPLLRSPEFDEDVTNPYLDLADDPLAADALADDLD
jgi:tellurite resistance protein